MGYGLQDPITNSEPRVRQLVIGPYRETDMGPQGLARAGFRVFISNLAAGTKADFGFQKKLVENKMNKKIITILCSIGVVILIAVVAYFCYEYWQQGMPQYSFAQMQMAAKSHNTTMFDKYFNTDAIFDNVWPRLQSEYVDYFAQSGESALQQSVDVATLGNQSSTIQQELETDVYDYVLGKSNTDQQSEYKEGYLSAILQAKPSFTVQDGIASFGLTYADYGNQNPQNYPVYKITVIMQQQSDRHWEVTDIQGLEDIFSDNLADAIRLNAIQTIIPNLANGYLVTGQQPYLTNDNWQTVLAGYAVQRGATTTLPQDPLNSYGNIYEFAISSGGSLKDYEYVVKANLATVTDISQASWNGLTYSEILKDLSSGSNMILGIDCNPPAYCQLGWGTDSSWAQILSNASNNASQ